MGKEGWEGGVGRGRGEGGVGGYARLDIILKIWLDNLSDHNQFRSTFFRR